jgi:hypothetical protein
MLINPATEEIETRKIMVQSQPGKSVRFHLNKTGVVHMVEWLPDKCQAMNSNPSTKYKIK